MRFRGRLVLFRVVGRCLPTEKNKNPTLYQMRIYAPDYVTAKSRFWHFLKKMKKVKKTTGEIVHCQRINENASKVKTFGIWLRYTSNSGDHNMYKEYRDVTSAAAVTQCYREMGGQHRAQADAISVIRVEALPEDKVRRPALRQFLDKNVKFPLPRALNRRFHKPRFTTTRPSTFTA